MKEIINEWKKSFDEAVDSIEKAITPKSHDDIPTAKFRKLAKWMLENKYSPYDYMSFGHQNFKSNPYNTDFSLSTLHHALVDDGDVAFVTFKVEGEIKRIFIIFANRHDEYFNKICREENQETIMSLISLRESYISVLNTMKQNGLGTVLKKESSLKESDFIFEAHNDPLLFIEEFEMFQLDKAEKNKILIENRDTLKVGKKF